MFKLNEKAYKKVSYLLKEFHTYNLERYYFCKRFVVLFILDGWVDYKIPVYPEPYEVDLK